MHCVYMHTEPKKDKKNNEESRKKQKTKMLRRNSPVTKCVESVLRPEVTVEKEGH